ncbi:MAG: methyltransferase domain-containing protein [Propionicimonas sp.]
MKLLGQLARPKRPEQVTRAQILSRGVSVWIDEKSVPMLRASLYGRAVEMLDLTPEDEVLEVACGVGALLQRNAGQVRHVAALEQSAIQVRYARMRLAERIAAGTAEVVQGDAAALPWDDGRFTAVVCVAGLELMPDPWSVLVEIRRVLRPGGRTVVTMGMRGTDRSGQDRLANQGFWSPTEDQVRAALRRAGFANVEIGYSKGGAGVVSGAARWLGRVAYGSSEMRMVRARARVEVAARAVRA